MVNEQTDQCVWLSIYTHLFTFPFLEDIFWLVSTLIWKRTQWYLGPKTIIYLRMINLLFTWQTDLSISPGECDNCVLLVCVYRQTDRRTGSHTCLLYEWQREEMDEKQNELLWERNKVVILSHSIFPTKTNYCHKT